MYTDGSCHTKYHIGGWAALVFTDGESVLLQGEAIKTTHNRMELTAVVKAFEYVESSVTEKRKIQLFTDSQYIVDLPGRETRLTGNAFTSKKGTAVRNADLLKTFFYYSGKWDIECVKIKAHRKKTMQENHNRTVDKIARSIVRKAAGRVSACRDVSC